MKIFIQLAFLGFVAFRTDQVDGTEDKHHMECSVNTVISGKNTIGSFVGILNKLEVQSKCFDGVVIDGVCYGLLYRVMGSLVTYDQAKQLCEYQDGALAGIKSEEAYSTLFDYIKRTWSLNKANKWATSVLVHLGSKYEDEKVTLSDGTQGYASWHPGYPSAGKYMVVEVPISPSHTPTNVGVKNLRTPLTQGAVLCQF